MLKEKKQKAAAAHHPDVLQLVPEVARLGVGAPARLGAAAGEACSQK